MGFSEKQHLIFIEIDIITSVQQIHDISSPYAILLTPTIIKQRKMHCLNVKLNMHSDIRLIK